jgi:hypothetical protein
MERSRYRRRPDSRPATLVYTRSIIICYILYIEDKSLSIYCVIDSDSRTTMIAVTVLRTNTAAHQYYTVVIIQIRISSLPRMSCIKGNRVHGCNYNNTNRISSLAHVDCNRVDCYYCMADVGWINFALYSNIVLQNAPKTTHSLQNRI